MTESILVNLVQEDFGLKKEGANWYRAEEHSSLIVNADTGRWFWNSENKGGDALAYLIQIRHYNKAKALEMLGIREKLATGLMPLEEKERPVNAPYEKMVDVLWDLGKTNRDYWYSRKLTDKTIDRYRLGFYDGWNTVPLYIGSELINLQCRRDIPEKKIRLWYHEEKWRPVLINADMLNLVDTIFITEGTIDCILLTQEGIPAVAQTSGAVYWSPYWYPFFSRMKNIYYITDQDEAGRKAAARVAQALGEDRVLIYQFENKKEKFDTVDWFREGGTAKEFKELVKANSKSLSEIGEMNEYRIRHRRSLLSVAR
jgi:DNA primase